MMKTERLSNFPKVMQLGSDLSLDSHSASKLESASSVSRAKGRQSSHLTKSIVGKQCLPVLVGRDGIFPDKPGLPTARKNCLKPLPLIL